MTLTLLLQILSATIGLAVGSFVNVVIARVPNGVSVAVPASACPKCGAAILKRDNIPVLSWILLRGKCRHCSQPISWQYPLVELATALGFAVVTTIVIQNLNLNTTAEVASAVLVGSAFAWFVATAIALVVIDIRHNRLPNSLVYPLYSVGLFLLTASSLLTQDADAIVRAVTGLTVCSFAYGSIFVLAPGGMGWGDVKLAGIIGFFLGWIGWGALFLGVLSAFGLGATFGLALIGLKRARANSSIPFGPWMIAGTFFGFVIGNQAWSSYLKYLASFKY